MTGILFLAALATGYWLRSLGKPLNLTLSNFHKLLALAWAVFTLILLFHLPRQVEFRDAFFAAIALLILSMIALIWSGSALTMPQTRKPVWLALHRIATAFAAIAASIAAKLILLNN